VTFFRLVVSFVTLVTFSLTERNQTTCSKPALFWEVWYTVFQLNETWHQHGCWDHLAKTRSRDRHGSNGVRKFDRVRGTFARAWSGQTLFIIIPYVGTGKIGRSWRCLPFCRELQTPNSHSQQFEPFYFLTACNSTTWHSLQALHRGIKATFARAPAAGDAYVSTEVRWAELERLFQSPKEPWTHMCNKGLSLRFGLICCLGRNIEGKLVELGSWFCDSHMIAMVRSSLTSWSALLWLGICQWNWFTSSFVLFWWYGARDWTNYYICVCIYTLSHLQYMAGHLNTDTEHLNACQPCFALVEFGWHVVWFKARFNPSVPFVFSCGCYDGIAERKWSRFWLGWGIFVRERGHIDGNQCAWLDAFRLCSAALLWRSDRQSQLTYWCCVFCAEDVHWQQDLFRYPCQARLCLQVWYLFVFVVWGRDFDV